MIAFIECESTGRTNLWRQMLGYLWGKGGCDGAEAGRVADNVLFLMRLCFLSKNSGYIWAWRGGKSFPWASYGAWLIWKLNWQGQIKRRKACKCIECKFYLTWEASGGNEDLKNRTDYFRLSLMKSGQLGRLQKGKAYEVRELGAT